MKPSSERLRGILARRSRSERIGFAFLVVVTLAAADSLMPVGMSMTVFYLLPVALTAWFVGRREGILLAVATVTFWLSAELLAAPSTFAHPLIPFWNFLARLPVFVAFALVLSTLKRRLESEGELLGRVQRRLLPREIPQVPGFEIAGTWRPALSVSGDYFDVLRLGERRVAACIGDVTGKGMEAALIMSNLQAAVRALVADNPSPAHLASRINEILCGNVMPGRFVSFFCCVLNAGTRELTYTNAGHNPPLRLRADGSAERLERTGPVLGVFPEAVFHESTIELQPAERLAIYTDGLTEFRGAREEEFGEERLERLLADGGELGAIQLKDRILEALGSFQGGRELQDDVTFLVVSVEGRRRSVALEDVEIV